MSNNGVILDNEQQWRNGRDNPQWAFSCTPPIGQDRACTPLIGQATCTPLIGQAKSSISHAFLSLAKLHALLSLVKLSHAFLMHSSHWPSSCSPLIG
jgi:hypothetical protein